MEIFFFFQYHFRVEHFWFYFGMEPWTLCSNQLKMYTNNFTRFKKRLLPNGRWFLLCVEMIPYGDESVGNSFLKKNRYAKKITTYDVWRTIITYVTHIDCTLLFWIVSKRKWMIKYHKIKYSYKYYENICSNFRKINENR